MSNIVPTQIILLDGFAYAVEADSYTRSWVRQFTFSISAAVIQVNFVDRGPGVRRYNMNLILITWPPTSLPYQMGVTQTIDQQRVNIEASYNKIATPLSYTDPLGIQPTKPGTTTVTGVFFTNLVQVIPKYSTANRPYLTYQIELMDSTSEVT